MHMLSLEHFDEFLTIACQEPESMRLLLVFSRKELPQNATDEQSRAYEAGEGGHLAPVAIVDKDPVHLQDYNALVEEAQQMVGEWDALFVAALIGQANQPITVKDVDDAGEKMVHAIRNGLVSNFLVFDRQGSSLQLSHS
jgi:hypothetical protein